MPAKKKSSSRGDTWSVDTVSAIGWVVTRTVAEAGIQAAGETLDSDAELARLRKEQADKLERERKVAEGKLLPADQVKAGMLKTFMTINAKLGAFPSRMAHIVRPDDPRTARRHLEVGVEDLRAELRRPPDFSNTPDAAEQPDG